MIVRPWPFAALFALANIFVGGVSLADVTKDQCLDANTRAQWRRQEGNFAEARALLRVCSDAACPQLVRDDCEQRMDDLERAQPTIVFDVKDPAGNDLSTVAISLDGRPLADKATGTALAADPGEHTFTFAVANQPPVSRTFVLREGDKGRHESIMIGSAAATPTTLVPFSPAPQAVQGATSGSVRRALVYGALGLGGLGVVVGSVAGVVALGAKSSLDGQCPTRSACPGNEQPDIDRMNDSSTVSTIGFGVGVAALAVAGILLLTSPATPPRRGGAAKVEASARLSAWIGIGAAGLAGHFE